ncbi:tol-pal system protein YbgF [candidate division KSB1 bacterium]|nr:tol-pal system protein YbgF [candidate division KSB1 bacterium]
MKNQFASRKLSSLAIAIIFIIALAVGCGKKADFDENADIGGKDNTEFDELFNTTTSEDDAKKESGDEEEVLKLLGLTKEEKAENKQPVEEKASSEAEGSKAVETLEKEIDAKELEIQKLASELDEERKRSNELAVELENERSRSKLSTSASLPSGGYQARYTNAREEYEARRYKAAIPLFEELLASNPDNSYADNCQYWIGECYYGLGMYTKAIAAFEKVFSFPNSNKNDDAQLKLGMCYLRLNERERAREEFERLVTHYPKSEYITKARRFLSAL